ncbi:MAG: hypothetical protein JO317_04395 [Verrucomicrobiae bacterium]|nr:hypothetical protein [Verrucomicrobiae bacterium]
MPRWIANLEAIGRACWREIYREIGYEQVVDFRRQPNPFLKIHWRSKSNLSFRQLVAFSGDASTCRIDPTAYVEGGAPITLGDRVVLEPGVLLATSSHRFRHGQFALGRIEARPIVIEDNVKIGAGSIICGGVRLGKGCVIQPDSVVSNTIAPGVTAGGVPARPYVRQSLPNAAVLPALLNRVATGTYLSATSVIIRRCFGNQIRIERGAFINREITIKGRGKLRIGARAFLAPRVEIDLTDDSEVSVIDHDVWIASGTKLVAPFRVRASSILAAGCHFSGFQNRTGVWAGRPPKRVHRSPEAVAQRTTVRGQKKS